MVKVRTGAIIREFYGVGTGPGPALENIANAIVFPHSTEELGTAESGVSGGTEGGAPGQRTWHVMSSPQTPPQRRSRHVQARFTTRAKGIPVAGKRVNATAFLGLAHLRGCSYS